MAEKILMPRMGNTVESCLIISWNKKEGDTVEIGDVICEAETDKAAVDVESESAGILLKILYQEGDDVPVLAPIAIVGTKDEDISEMLQSLANTTKQKTIQNTAGKPEKTELSAGNTSTVFTAVPKRAAEEFIDISPRAKARAQAKGIDYTQIQGTGPGDRIIEQDIQNVINRSPSISKAALKSGKNLRIAGSGISGRILSADNSIKETSGTGFTVKPFSHARKIISQRMTDSLQHTAQYTVHGSADARQILALRKEFKANKKDTQLQSITISDLVLFAVTRTLTENKELNALLENENIIQYDSVHLGFAVDTPKALMVPVIVNAEQKDLPQLSIEAKQLAEKCMAGKISPDEMAGGTFTVSNLGMFGVERFTPILNTPQVGILGVCSITPKMIIEDENYITVPHLGLSLTVNHQVIDGAPAARFLQALAKNIADVNWPQK